MLVQRFLSTICVAIIVLLASVGVRAGSTFEEYEGRTVTAVEVVFEGSPADTAGPTAIQGRVET